MNISEQSVFINNKISIMKNSPCSRLITVQQITSGPRKVAQVAKRQKLDENEAEPGHVARNELDTRADTICAGANFMCIHPTGMTCSVQGFHQSFAPIPEIPVATVATAWDDPTTGQTFILIIHQALYFGKQLDHSLINPNQIRITGIPVCDDPFDKHRSLGIDLGDFNIPFQTEGNTIYFESRVPTTDEMENCQYISLTDDDDWDPTSVNLQDYMTKEVKQVNVRCETMEENESEHVLGTISSVYSIGSLTRRIQETVRVTSQVASQTRHSKLSPEHLARTWNIGLDRAKDTIQVTTQRGIRFAIHPIHRRYRVDHLLHLGLQARRIVKQFYVDHMQSRVKSLSQNTGAFIFTTGTFTKIYPVDSTAKAGEVLAEFVRDVGVPTDLWADLASYFSGRNTDFVKEAKRL
jgi:hypothetical protein